jgi:hypothetical protein
MERFFVTPIRDEGKPYWMANFPGERPAGSRKARPRRQKKFSKFEDAQRFLEDARAEYFREKRVRLACNRELMGDVMRAIQILSDVPGATMTKAAKLLKECRSSQERRGGKFEEPKDRWIELSPRIYLGVVSEARRLGMRVEDLVSGILWGYLVEESGKREC